MHGNTFHSLWMLQLENNLNDITHLEEEKEHSTSQSSISFRVATNHHDHSPNKYRSVICSPYHIAKTPKCAMANNNKQSQLSNSNDYLLTNIHLILLLITSSINALLVKVFCVFSGFIYLNIPFTTLTLILGISTLSTIFSVFINPYILFLRCNILIFVVQSLQIIGIIIILTFPESYILLTIAICFIFNTYQIHWGVSNTMISCFISPKNTNKITDVKHAAMKKKRYLTIFNTQWTISTLYFVVVGMVSQSSSFFGFLSFVMAFAIFLAILNGVLLPKQPAIPTQITVNNQIYNHVHIFNLIPGSLSKDLRILFASSNRKFHLVCFGFMLTFFIWGWFYVTFGPFLQELYELDAVKFGAYIAIIEGVGNGLAMLCYIYFGSIFVKAKNNSNTAYIETEILLFISSVILFISFLCLSLITHVHLSSFHLLLHHETVMGLVIIFYFIGHEGTVIGLMILHVEVTPVLQQPRASGVVSMLNCIFIFISQSIIIGPLSLKYYTITFETESIILLMTSTILLIVITMLTITMYKSRNKKLKVSFMSYESDIDSMTSTSTRHQTILSPMLKDLNGKTYTYHTLDSIHNSSATDLVFNDYKI